MLQVYHRLKGAQLSSKAANQLISQPATRSDVDELLIELKKVLATKEDLRNEINRLIAEQKKTRQAIMINILIIAVLFILNNPASLDFVSNLLGIFQ
ncbi:MAG: hypothetical protein H7844_02240 [Nitrospirae bacterium YQR-1]